MQISNIKRLKEINIQSVLLKIIKFIKISFYITALAKYIRQQTSFYKYLATIPSCVLTNN